MYVSQKGQTDFSTAGKATKLTLINVTRTVSLKDVLC